MGEVGLLAQLAALAFCFDDVGAQFGELVFQFAEPFTPLISYAARMPGPADRPAILVVNYAQLRLNTEWFHGHSWDAVILDEAQFIKNPTSQTAAIARAIPALHRVALTGTPIENRLLDLWSLFAFAQPGLLGSQAGFRRQ